jgi:hypothetical protein
MLAADSNGSTPVKGSPKVLRGKDDAKTTELGDPCAPFGPMIM